MEVARLLLADFNSYFFKTSYVYGLRAQGRYVAAVKETPERLNALERMAQWCREHGLDPRHWLYTLFVSRRWTYAPQWNQLTSPRHLERYKSFTANVFYQNRIGGEWRADQERRGVTYNVNRDMTATTEGIKRRYLALQDADRCMSLVRDETLGYHPKSIVCQECPRAGDCERLLRSLATDFDIIALRRWDITLAQAQEQARHRAYVLS